MGARARVLVGFGAFGAFWGAWGANLPLIQRHAGVDDGQLGLALPWIGVGALATLRLSGAVADRHPRATLPVGIVLLGLSALLPVALRGTAGVVVSCLVIGAVSGAGDAAVNAEGARYEAGGGAVLALGHGAFSAVVVGGSLGSAGLIATGATGPWPLAVVGGAVVAAGVVIALLPAPASPPDPAASAASAASAPPPERAAGRGRPRRTLLLLGVLGAVAYLVENAWQSWSAIHVHTTLHASAAVAAAAPAVFASCAAAGRFGSHVLQRRVGERRLFAAGAALAAAGGVLAATAPDPAVAFAGIAIAGAGTSVCAPLLIGAAGRASPEAVGAATSTVISLAYLGFVFGPALVGLLADAAGLRVALIGTAAAAALLVPAGRAIPRRPATEGPR